MSLFKRLSYKRRKFYDDDFDWDNYTKDSYQRRLIEGGTESELLAVPGDLEFDAGSGVVSTAKPRLHMNSLTIYEAIGQLQPNSVHEVGCGGGVHVGNAAVLFPEIPMSGGDRSTEQLKLALQQHKNLQGRVFEQDITMPLSKHWPKADFVFTQAVLMHIHTAVSHFVALSNLVAISNKYVFLMENFQCHNFVQIIRALADGGHFVWPETHVYEFTGSRGNKGILLSKAKLNYPELADDAPLRAGVKASVRRLKRAKEDSARGIFGQQNPFS